MYIIVPNENTIKVSGDDKDDYQIISHLKTGSIGFKRWIALEYSISQKIAYLTQLDDSLKTTDITWLRLCEVQQADDNEQVIDNKEDTFRNIATKKGALAKFLEFSEDFYLSLKQSGRKDIAFIGPTGKLAQSSIRANNQPYVYRVSRHKNNVWFKLYSMVPSILSSRNVHYRPDLGYMTEDTHFNLECTESKVIQLGTLNFLITYSRPGPRM